MWEKYMETLDLITLKADIATEVDRVIDRRFSLFALPKTPMSPDYEPRNIGVDEGITFDPYAETSVELDSVRGELAEFIAEDAVSESTQAGFEVESMGIEAGSEASAGGENE